MQLGLNCQTSDEGQFVTSMVSVVNVGSWCITGGLYWEAGEERLNNGWGSVLIIAIGVTLYCN